MDGTTIRQLRKRLGITQRQLAERLDVDQGTVSRWERGIDGPRPRRAAALRDLLVKDEDQRALARALAVVRHDLMSAPASFLDSRMRVAELSPSGSEFLRRRGYDPQSLIGKDVFAWSDRFRLPDFPKMLQDSGILSGDALLFRFVRNERGRGHATLYEPIFASGEMIGVLNYVTAMFDFPGNDESTFELVECVPANAPNRIETLHAGARSDAARVALRAWDDPAR